MSRSRSPRVPSSRNARAADNQQPRRDAQSFSRSYKDVHSSAARADSRHRTLEDSHGGSSRYTDHGPRRDAHQYSLPQQARHDARGGNGVHPQAHTSGATGVACAHDIRTANAEPRSRLGGDSRAGCIRIVATLFIVF